MSVCVCVCTSAKLKANYTVNVKRDKFCIVRQKTSATDGIVCFKLIRTLKRETETANSSENENERAKNTPTNYHFRIFGVSVIKYYDVQFPFPQLYVMAMGGGDGGGCI